MPSQQTAKWKFLIWVTTCLVIKQVKFCLHTSHIEGCYRSYQCSLMSCLLASDLRGAGLVNNFSLLKSVFGSSQAKPMSTCEGVFIFILCCFLQHFKRSLLYLFSLFLLVSKFWNFLSLNYLLFFLIIISVPLSQMYKTHNKNRKQSAEMSLPSSVAPCHWGVVANAKGRVWESSR